jgi:hypothetical protein
MRLVNHGAIVPGGGTASAPRLPDCWPKKGHRSRLRVVVKWRSITSVRSGDRRHGRTVPTIRPSTTASGGDRCPVGLGPLEPWTNPDPRLMPRLGRRDTCPWWGAGLNIAG